MLQILNNGVDQYVRFRASAEGAVGPFTGTLEGDVLPGAIMIFTEFKATPEDTVLPEADTEVIWKATTGEWQAKIPEEYITRNGLARINISGTGMIGVAIDLVVGTIGGSGTGGSDIVITGYTHNATAQTLTITDSEYTSIGIERIKEIWNLSKHCKIYDYLNPQANASTGHEIGIQIADGVIHYDYDTTSKADADKIMIVVFAASA